MIAATVSAIAVTRPPLVVTVSGGGDRPMSAGMALVRALSEVGALPNVTHLGGNRCAP